jgi:hypothetical protein
MIYNLSMKNIFIDNVRRNIFWKKQKGRTKINNNILIEKNRFKNKNRKEGDF